MIRSEKGFTLLELMAVLSIIGVLILIAVPNCESVVSRSRTQVCEDNLAMLNHAAEVYHEVENAWPSGQQTLMDAGYIDHIMKCPVNNDYYIYENNRFVCSGH